MTSYISRSVGKLTSSKPSRLPTLSQRSCESSVGSRTEQVSGRDKISVTTTSVPHMYHTWTHVPSHLMRGACHIPANCTDAVNWRKIVQSDFVFWNFKMLKQSRVMNDWKMFAKILKNIWDFIFHPLDVDTTNSYNFLVSFDFVEVSKCRIFNSGHRPVLLLNSLVHQSVSI